MAKEALIVPLAAAGPKAWLVVAWPSGIEGPSGPAGPGRPGSGRARACRVHARARARAARPRNRASPAHPGAAPRVLPRDFGDAQRRRGARVAVGRNQRPPRRTALFGVAAQSPRQGADPRGLVGARVRRGTRARCDDLGGDRGPRPPPGTPADCRRGTGAGADRAAARLAARARHAGDRERPPGSTTSSSSTPRTNWDGSCPTRSRTCSCSRKSSSTAGCSRTPSTRSSTSSSSPTTACTSSR